MMLRVGGRDVGGLADDSVRVAELVAPHGLRMEVHFLKQIRQLSDLGLPSVSCLHWFWTTASQTSTISSHSQCGARLPPSTMADRVIEEMGWEAMREKDAINLMVNLLGEMLDNPDATVEQVMANYSGGADEVRSWWPDWDRPAEAGRGRPAEADWGRPAAKGSSGQA